MVDASDAIGKARAAMTERAELPGMSLMEHLDELRRRIVHSALYLGAGFILAWVFRDRFVTYIQAPLIHIGKTLVFTHPMDALNLQLQVSLVGGAIVASPFFFRSGCSLRPAFTRKSVGSSSPSWRPPSDSSSPARPSATTTCCRAPSRFWSSTWAATSRP